MQMALCICVRFGLQWPLLLSMQGTPSIKLMTPAQTTSRPALSVEWLRLASPVYPDESCWGVWPLI
jgi:hypothetical protein